MKIRLPAKYPKVIRQDDGWVVKWLLPNKRVRVSRPMGTKQEAEAFAGLERGETKHLRKPRIQIK